MIVVTAAPHLESATASLRLGAGDYLTKPLDRDALAASAARLLGGRRLEAEYELLRRQVERPYSFDDMIGGCPAMHKVFDTIEQVADSDVDVLVVGETGTGKELVARSIHRRSRRAAGPFVPVDCGAIPESLLESEFFGHEKGAFTGADSRRIGLLEFADRGTFFLDELGELPLLLQAKLLRTLQERKIRRVGGREEIDDRRADRGRHGAQPGRDDPPAAVSPGPVLPDQRRADRSAAACASGATTSVCWPSTWRSATAAKWVARSRASRPRPTRCWPSIAGRATCASCKT